MDPEESMSDWKIEIVVAATNSSATNENDGTSSSSTAYHVHQCILGVGGKKSNLFVKHFRGPFSESETKSSRMEFEPEVADVFPIVLDYMYSPDNKLDITTKNIPAVMALADYLDIASVRDKIAKYCHQNLTLATCAIFYGYGEDYIIPSLRTSSIETCYMNFLAICPDTSSTAFDSRLTFWFDLRKHIKDEEWLLHFSRHIAAFCVSHKANLTINDFYRVTNSKFLPKIHPKAAEQLIQVELGLANMQSDATKLSNLQVRCIDAIADAWKTHTCSKKRLVCFSPLVLSTLLIMIADKASTESFRLSEINRIQVSNVPHTHGNNSYLQGVYSLDPNCSYGSHCFVKEGQWNDKQSWFYLYLQEDQWRTAVLYPGPNPGQLKCDLLYSSCVLAGHTSSSNSHYGAAKLQPTIKFL
jgi:hypothetical protein